MRTTFEVVILTLFLVICGIGAFIGFMGLLAFIADLSLRLGMIS
jgi:hypothetical protein